MSFNVIRENKILVKISEFTVTRGPSVYTMTHPDLTVTNLIEKCIDIQRVK